MFDDIIKPKRKGVWIEPGIYYTLYCAGGCGRTHTAKIHKDYHTEKWTCAKCCDIPHGMVKWSVFERSYNV